MKAGLYRNTIGAELYVLWSVSAVREFHTIGGIYEAQSRDPLFGSKPYLVTEQSMTECGYVLIEEAAS